MGQGCHQQPGVEEHLSERLYASYLDSFCWQWAGARCLWHSAGGGGPSAVPLVLLLSVHSSALGLCLPESAVYFVKVNVVQME